MRTPRILQIALLLVSLGSIASYDWREKRHVQREDYQAFANWLEQSELKQAVVVPMPYLAQELLQYLPETRTSLLLRKPDAGDFVDTSQIMLAVHSGYETSGRNLARALNLTGEQHFGALLVLYGTNQHALSTAWDFVSALERLEVTMHDKGPQRPCPWNAAAREFRCVGGPPWNVVHTMPMDIDGSERKLLFAHPIDNQELHLAYQVDKPVTQLEVDFGFTTEAVGRGHDPVQLDLWLDGKKNIGWTHGNIPGLRREHVEIPAATKRVELVVSCEQSGMRHLGVQVKGYP